MRAISIIIASTLAACVPDGGQGTEGETFDPSSTSGGPELPEGLWGECLEDRTCPNRELNCVAGQEVELDQDGAVHLGQSESMCTVGCSDEVACPLGASCLEFPSQPGIGWCYIPCDLLPCPEGMVCLDLGYSLQQQGEHHYCV